MPSTKKVLGQAGPGNTNNTDLYTVPAGREAVISTLSISNVTASPRKARIWVRVGGTTATAANQLAEDIDIPANALTALTLGITLGAGDIITVRSDSANALTFMAFGEEIS
jgi:hypothetical protein